MQIKIDKRITEQEIMESAIMYQISGEDIKLVVLFYALKKGWDKDKLIYYLNLLEEIKNEPTIPKTKKEMV